MFNVTGIGSASGFADVIVITWDIINTSTSVVIDNAIDVCPLQCVFRVHQMLSQRASGFERGYYYNGQISTNKNFKGNIMRVIVRKRF